MCLVAHLCPTLCNPMDYSPPSSSVHRDSPGKEYFSGLPCLPPGDLPDSGIELTSLMSLAFGGRFFTTSTTWEALLDACESEVAQSCPTLCNPMDYSPPGSPIPGILQARTLEWVAISFSNA